MYSHPTMMMGSINPVTTEVMKANICMVVTMVVELANITQVVLELILTILLTMVSFVVVNNLNHDINYRMLTI